MTIRKGKLEINVEIFKEGVLLVNLEEIKGTKKFVHDQGTKIPPCEKWQCKCSSVYMLEGNSSYPLIK